jgi:hypothetical protein
MRGPWACIRKLRRNHVLHTYWLLEGQSIPTTPDGVPDEFDRYLAEIESQRSHETR